jgi:hypothetical protein
MVDWERLRLPQMLVLVIDGQDPDDLVLRVPDDSTDL